MEFRKNLLAALLASATIMPMYAGNDALENRGGTNDPPKGGDILGEG